MALTQAQIQTAFQNDLGRQPSGNELNSYFAVSQSGALSDSAIFQSIAQSQEAIQVADPVIRFYESAFGRVPDQAGLANAEAYIRAFTPTAQTYQNLAVQFTQSQEFINRFGAGNTVDNAYVTALYQTILGRTPSATEVAGYTSGSNGYTTRAQVLYAISQSNEAQGISQAAVNGFLQNAAAGTAVYTGDLYTNANGAPNGANSGQTFTLTNQTDNLTGTAGADTFIGNQNTLQTADTINGGAGNDTLRLVENNGATLVPVLTSVERIEVQNFGGPFGTVENVVLANASGYNTLASVNGNGGVQYNSVNNIVAAEATGTTGGVFQINYNNPVVAGANDVQTLALNSATIATNVAGGGVGGGNAAAGLLVNGIETLAITATNTNGNVGSAIDAVGDAALKAITVAGSGQLTIGAATVNGVTGLQGAAVNGVNTLSFDASANTGGVTATFAAGTDTVKGGAGNDKFIFGTNLDITDTVDGGAGTNTISIAGVDFTATGAANAGQITDLNTKVTNIQTLELTGGNGQNIAAPGAVIGAPIVLDQSAITNTQITKILFNDNGGDTVNNAVSTETYALGTAHNGTDTFNFAQGQQTLNLSLEGSPQLNVVSAGVTVNNGNTVNINSVGSAAGDHVLTSLTTANNETVNITGNHDLNLGTLNVTTATTAAVPALGDTVNAGTLTGKLTVTGSAANDSITVGSGGSLITGSVGADSYTLGAGKDQLNYTTSTNPAVAGANLGTAAGFSTTQDLDTAISFTAGQDKFILATTVTGVNQSSVTGTGALLADLASAANPFANNNNADVITITGGTDAGKYLVVNSDPGATATSPITNTDFVVKLVGLNGQLAATDFVKVVS